MTILHDYAELEQAHSSGVYAKRPVTFVQGQGARLLDDTGRWYIDCASGIGVANIGHCHPAIIAALREQSERLMICPEAFHNDQRALLQAELLATFPSGYSRVFLSNSGTEAIEAALKFARATTGRSDIVATMRGFHGRTMGALSATWEPHYREPFGPLVPGYSHVPFNDIEALTAAVSATTAAVLVEVIQGEGGVRPATAAFVQAAQALCQQHGALLIIDEVQTGFARTGRMFGFEHFELTPDIVCLAKALGGGLPMGATVLHEQVGSLQTGWHGSTFGGNPLACATARASLRVIESEQLVVEAERKGAWLRSQLEDLRLVREVRGLGLMLGLELRTRAMPILQTLQLEHGIVALNAGKTVLRLLPPLVITQDELQAVAQALRTVLGARQ